MSKKLYYVAFDDDDACLLCDHRGEEIKTFDTYHGEKLDRDLMEKLGFEVSWLNWVELISEDEYESADCTDEIPSKALILERLKAKIDG